MKLRRLQHTAEVPSVAMGDLAFNLLVFFVITARAQDDSHVKWTPAVAPHVEQVGHARVSVSIDKDNKLYLNGQQIGLSQLATSITDQLQGQPPGKRTVLLKAHRDTTTLTFEPVIQAISEAGGELVHMLQQEVI